MYSVVKPILIGERSFEPGDVVSESDIHLFVPDLLVLEAVEEIKEDPSELVF